MVVKRLLAILTLLVFSLSYTPVELWHDCDHHVNAEQEFEHGIAEEDCAICDFHFSSFTPLHTNEPGVLEAVNFEILVCVVPDWTPKYQPDTDNRGPPAA